MPANYSDTSGITFEDGNFYYEPEVYEFELSDISDFYADPVVDATSTVGVQYAALMDVSLDSQLTITKGRYRFYISNPGILSDDFTPIAHYVSVDGVQKRFTVEGLTFDVVNNELVATVNIIDNPIPLIIIWAGIFAICAAVGAISANSVLTHVEKIIETPIIWPIVAIVGAVLVIPLIGPYVK